MAQAKEAASVSFYFTPTSSSWLNQVERWFGIITDRMIWRGTFCSVQELERTTYQWLATWNSQQKPFIWKATADVILDKVRRCRPSYCKIVDGTGEQVRRRAPGKSSVARFSGYPPIGAG